MTERITKDVEHSYICGQCGLEQYAVVGEETPAICIDCGYEHKDRNKYDIPSKIKIDLTQY